MFTYKLINSSLKKIDKYIINNIFNIIEKKINKNQKWILNIIFIKNVEIKKLNKKYRKKNESTDVLSFHYFDNFSTLKNEDIAWEIVLSIEKIKTQANEFWISEEQEFYKLLIHSILHILWYDHKNNIEYENMKKIEDYIWEKIF